MQRDAGKCYRVSEARVDLDSTVARILKFQGSASGRGAFSHVQSVKSSLDEKVLQKIDFLTAQSRQDRFQHIEKWQLNWEHHSECRHSSRQVELSAGIDRKCDVTAT
jgi:hypothetical protein